MKSILTFFVSLLSFVNFAQTKYVDVVNGNDSNDGNSTSSAWQTIQKAMDEVTAGTTVFIRTGTYVEPFLQLNVSGTPGSLVSFRNYPGENPLISGNNQQGTLLYIENQSYFEINGLTFANLIGNFSVGVEITGDSHHFNFTNNEIHHISWTANTSTLPSSNDNANGFVVYGTTPGGVHDFVVDSCNIHHNTTGFSENLTLDGNVFNFQVIANTVHDNSNIGIVCAGNYGVIADLTLDQTRDGLVRDNVCYNNTSSYATSAGIYVDGGKNIDVFRNLCYGNGFGIEVGAEENGTTTNIRVYDNLVYDNREAGISIGGYDVGTTGQVTQSVVRNNTFYNNGTSGNSLGELYITKVSGSLIENNIFVSGTTGKLVTRENISPQTNNTYQFNLWYTTGTFAADINGFNYSDFTSMNTALGQNFSAFANPDFESTAAGAYNFSLTAGSPALNTGNPASILYANETDYPKGPRISDSGIDIGAYEWYTTSVPEVSENWLQIFPNPTSDFVMIKTTKPGSLKIVDAEGKVIMETYIQESKFINFDSFNKGHYFIKLTTESGMQTKLFLKN